MKTKEQIKQILKAKLNVSKDNRAKVIQLKEPIVIIIRDLYLPRITISLISYEKKTDTIWLLGHTLRREPVKIKIQEAFEIDKSSYRALDKLTDTLQDLPTEIVDLPPSQQKEN